MLQVCRGECESINGEKGLYHRSPVGQTSIRLSHHVDPVPGYLLEIYRSSRTDKNADNRAWMFFKPAEALGICEAITGALYLVAFGIPMLVPHNTAAYREQTKEMRNVAAA